MACDPGGSSRARMGVLSSRRRRAADVGGAVAVGGVDAVLGIVERDGVRLADMLALGVGVLLRFGGVLLFLRALRLLRRPRAGGFAVTGRHFAAQVRAQLGG